VRYPPPERFATCRERFERAIAGTCEEAGDWPGSVVRGVYAALELAVEDPAAALVLSERSAARWRERDPDFAAMVDRFAAMLDRDAPPPNPRLPDAHGVVLCIASQVSLRIEVGRGEELMEIAPDLAFLALLPFVGFAEARRRVGEVSAIAICPG
jgi:hypothetical protein